MKNRLFLYSLMLLVLGCSSKGWDEAQGQIVDLSIKGDALHFSKGFSVSLIEGVTPEKSVSGATTTIKWTKGNIELGFLFKGKSPEVKLFTQLESSSEELGAISGRLTSDISPLINFGSKDLEISQALRRSPNGGGTLILGDSMQLTLPFLHSIQANDRATRWRYVDNVALRCPVKTKAEGMLRVGLPRVDILDRAEKIETQIITLISSPNEDDEEILTKKINTIMKGHSAPTDPRFGNGGLASAEGSSTFIGQTPPKDSTLSFISPNPSEDCKPSTFHMQGSPDLLYFPGVGHIVRSEASSSRIFRSSSLEKIRQNRQTSIVHLSLDEKLILQEGDGWTLSKRSALDFADLELFAEDGSVEVLGAVEYLDGVRKKRALTWSFLPDGTLTFECLKCESISDFRVRIADIDNAQIIDQPESYRREGEVSFWKFEKEKYRLKFKDRVFDGVDWRFGAAPN